MIKDYVIVERDSCKDFNDKRSKTKLLWREIPVKTSMTSGNVDATCGYFEWVDPPMCQCGREVLPKMVAKMNRLKKEQATSRRRERMSGNSAT
ncbi:uncharacterized protein LOC114299266 isoform X2 [Camellia sinensis]|uniref:uncharacterized protein LOC114299266 isoform X2 n=1 Tax=Camellia sinensis TaxID=4442 RepID=UPI001035C337|nr:uncharacterized protein LOC114299266 isoform X2 [Camellia sinensis]